MRYIVMLTGICIFMVWLIVIQLFIRNLEDYESRLLNSKMTIDVKIDGYDVRHKPPLVSATTESGEIIYLNDYDKKFEFSAQVYYNKWVQVTLVNHYYGILIIRIRKKIHSIIPIYKN